MNMLKHTFPQLPTERLFIDSEPLSVYIRRLCLDDPDSRILEIVSGDPKTTADAMAMELGEQERRVLGIRRLNGAGAVERAGGPKGTWVVKNDRDAAIWKRDGPWLTESILGNGDHPSTGWRGWRYTGKLRSGR